MKCCPNDIYKLLIENGVLLEKYCKNYCCNETILKQYISNKILIDDRFLYDESIPFNEELFLKIEEGIEYIKPYCFTFEDICNNIKKGIVWKY